VVRVEGSGKEDKPMPKPMTNKLRPATASSLGIPKWASSCVYELV
jgi:hypothetical protein